MHLYLISLKRAKHTCTGNCKSQWVPPTRFHHPCPLMSVCHHTPSATWVSDTAEIFPHEAGYVWTEAGYVWTEAGYVWTEMTDDFHCRDRCHHDANTFCRNMIPRQGQITWWHVGGWGWGRGDRWSLSGEASVVPSCWLLWWSVPWSLSCHSDVPIQRSVLTSVLAPAVTDWSLYGEVRVVPPSLLW